MMNKILFLLAALLPLGTTGAPSLDFFSVNIGVTNGLVVGGGQKVSDGPYLKQNYHLRVNDFFGSDGWYANLWAGINPDGPHEIDYSGGKLTMLGQNVELDLSVNYYDVNCIGLCSNGDIFVPKAVLTYNVPGSSAYYFAGAEPMFVINDSNMNGLYAYIGIGGSVSQGRLSLNGSLQLNDDSTFGADITGLKFVLQPEYAFNKRLSAQFLGLKYYAIPDQDGEDQEEVKLFEIGYNFK